ncbi:C4-dicarboxylate ABC transporter permease [Rubrobacter taiwanensis]|uniref:C4-dicarboxylate ABC transporter permease n=1 Tax=Rubrobacter taiwanensis TaxID=185139 RepID=A0A4R1BHU5_9ACTN|nr:tripartite tricarboxylate transporter permease [Rubrobacter taiwanensis]TCJ16846.1 C4-dicarboxylate ABC transporter permease [Rubrobacter taiwanensis]
MLELLVDAVIQNLSPGLFILIILGVIGGMALGAMPGLSVTVGLALLLPITFTMDPVSGLVLMGAFYMGAVYGGAFTSILVNAPGTPSSIATAFDGYPMTRQGRSEEAIVGVTIASVIGGLAGVAGLIFFAPLLANFVLNFGPQEYFWIGIFGLTMIASLAARSLVLGLIGGFLGLLLSSVGVAPVGGDVRFTFGFTYLQGGVPLIVALIGLFTVPVIIDMIANPGARHAEMMDGGGRGGAGVVWSTVRDVLSRPMNLIRSSVIGTVVGALPGAGGNIANLIAYNEAKRTSKRSERFGKGEVDGVVAPETANNAVVGAGLIPLLTLGIPGAPPDAVIYGVLLLHGLRPGPDLFVAQGPLVFTFMVSIAIAAIVMIPVGLIAGRALQRAVVSMPTRYLAPAIVLLTIVGSYAVRNNVADVGLMLLLGIAGYVLRELGIHPATIVLGLVLGPIIETGLVQGLLAASGLETPWTSFFTRPISLVIIAMTILAALWPLWVSRRDQRAREMQEEG